MFVTIINDCHDGNANARQETLLASLFKYDLDNISSVGIGFGDTIEASGNLIDILGISESHGIVLLNAAPRTKNFPNGTPFGHFYYKNVHVVSTVDGYSLSLVKKLKLTDSIELFDVPTVIDWAVGEKKIDKELGERIKVSQFRSLDFSPRVAHWIWEGWNVPSTTYPIDKILDAPNTIWYIDIFGNCKTTLLPEDINFKPGNEVEIKGVHIKCYQYLKDVPSGELAIIQGSSGIGDKKFLEIVINGDNVAKVLGLKVGDEI